MKEYLPLLVLLAALAPAQPQAPTVLTNETIVRMVVSGVPADVIIRTIDAAPQVAFGFLTNDLQMFARYKVPDDVVKAMAAKDKGKPVYVNTPVAAPSPQNQHITPANAKAPENINPEPRASKHAAETLDVIIIDRQNSDTSYNYFFPGYSNSHSNTDVNCFGSSTTVNCSGTTRTTGSSIPARAGSYSVRGATYSLQLPDGRVAIVNCESKYKLKGDYVNRRSCRMPLVNNIQAEFNGGSAKLRWNVSIDGNKFESETYKILAVLDKQTATESH